METMKFSLWHRIVAKSLITIIEDLRLVVSGKNREIANLKTEVNYLEKQTPVNTWAISQAHAAKQRVGELERDLAKTNLLRDALRNEKAYTLFLEDCLECKNPGDVFNALPLEKRKEYFDRVQ